MVSSPPPAAATDAPAVPAEAPPIAPEPGEGESPTPAAPAAPAAAAIAPGPAAAAAAPGPPPLDATTVRSAVQATLRYPALARKRGLEGTVMLRFHIGAAGAIDSLAVVTSAGDALDDAAREAVRRAAPFRTGPGWVRIPVVFDLGAAP
jgi:protein TonB